MWFVIIIAVLAVLLASVIYFITRAEKFAFIQKVGKNEKKNMRGIGAVFTLAILSLFYFTMGIVNAVVLFIHLVVFWLICDGIGKLIRKKKEIKRIYFEGICAIVITAVYMSFGWYYAHHVVATPYVVQTEKAVGEELRVVGFADSHVGAIFHWQGFLDHIDKMNAENPDIVVVAGDFVDDDTTKEDMVKSCEALGKLKTKYGVYYVFGNHDKGYYGGEYRGFSAEELVQNLEKNQVKVLQDDVVKIVDHVYVVGRQDREQTSRAKMSQLMERVTEEDFVIVLDHQPGDYDAQEEAKADLVISGHTHGGQFFPLNKLGEWTGMNDKTYGHEKRSMSDFVVSSGIADWALKFKTGCISEYLVIDIKKK